MKDKRSPKSESETEDESNSESNSGSESHSESHSESESHSDSESDSESESDYDSLDYELERLTDRDPDEKPLTIAYLIRLGKVSIFRKELVIGNEYPDDSIVFTFGINKDYPRQIAKIYGEYYFLRTKIDATIRIKQPVSRSKLIEIRDYIRDSCEEKGYYFGEPLPYGEILILPDDEIHIVKKIYDSIDSKYPPTLEDSLTEQEAEVKKWTDKVTKLKKLVSKIQLEKGKLESKVKAQRDEMAKLRS